MNHWAVGDRRPDVRHDDHEEELRVVFEHAVYLVKDTTDFRAVDVVDGVGADRAVEALVIEGHFAHVALLDGDAVFHSNGTEIGPGVVMSVAFDIVGAKVVERNDLTLRSRIGYHDGGASRAATNVEYSAPIGEVALSGEGHQRVHADFELRDKKTRKGPRREDREDDREPDGTAVVEGHRGSQTENGGWDTMTVLPHP